MRWSGLGSRRVKAKIKQVEPDVLLAPFDSFKERPYGAIITDRRKGTGKEQTFLAFKTLLQFSWARSKLDHEVEVGVTATGATRGLFCGP